MRTLVLSQSFEPLRVVPWQRAISLLTLGKVEVLEEYDDEVRSSTVVFKMPSVIRLVTSFTRKKKPVKFSRINVLVRDKYRCQYCGKKKLMKDLTYDHVVPKSRGGETVWTNIVSACGPCNRKKGNRKPHEAGMKLLTEPVRPRWLPVATITINQDSVPEGWRDYLYWTTELVP